VAASRIACFISSPLLNDIQQSPSYATRKWGHFQTDGGHYHIAYNNVCHLSLNASSKLMHQPVQTVFTKFLADAY